MSTTDNELYGKTANLAGLIEIQEGSVVSKTLVDRATGTVTLFAFDRDQGLSEHTAPFDALVTVLEGEVAITIDDEYHTVSAGEAIVMPADVPHALRAVDPMKMFLVMIKGE